MRLGVQKYMIYGASLIYVWDKRAKPLKYHENDIFCMLHPIYLLPTLYIDINSVCI